MRLRGYDYAQAGAYFVTICAHNRECVFGESMGGEMRLSNIGKIADECWNAIPEHFQQVELDEFVVMPNHIHGILVITDFVGATHASPLQKSPLQEQPRGPNPKSVGAIVGSFKSAVTTRINRLRDTPRTPIWQRNYYEHIIRTERELNVIREYIHNNPLKRSLDMDNPSNWKERRAPRMVNDYLRDAQILVP